MRELGRKGGLVSRSDRVAEDLALELRAQARAELQALLNSDEERVRLAAARSVGAYAPERAPGSDGEHVARKIMSTSPVPTWGQLVQVALDVGALVGRADGAVEVSGVVMRAHSPLGPKTRPPRLLGPPLRPLSTTRTRTGPAVRLLGLDALHVLPVASSPKVHARLAQHPRAEVDHV